MATFSEGILFYTEGLTHDEGNEIPRFSCRWRDDAQPVSILFGDGTEGDGVRYFSQEVQAFLPGVDRARLLLIRKRIEARDPLNRGGYLSR